MIDKIVETSSKEVIDFRKRPFFMVTKAVFSDTSKIDKHVDLVVYAVLCMFADNNDKTSYPSVSKISEIARCSDRVVHRSLKNLKEAGYIEIVNRSDRNGFKTSNQYVILD